MSSCEPACVAETLHPIFPWHHYWLLILLPLPTLLPCDVLNITAAQMRARFFPAVPIPAGKLGQNLPLWFVIL